MSCRLEKEIPPSAQGRDLLARRHDSFRRKNYDAWELVKTYGLDACAVFDVLTLSTVARELTVVRLNNDGSFSIL
jgi:hypothetical protein